MNTTMQNEFSKQDPFSHINVETAKAMHERTAEAVFVIVNKAKTSVLMDPGMDRPWSSRVRKVADHMASQVGGGCFVATLGDATRYLIRRQVEKN